MCVLGTGSVVMYMVMMRYRYSIPIRKKNLRPMIDLKTHTHTLPFTICHQWTNPDHMAEAQTRLLSEWSLVEVMSVMICTTVVESTCF